MSVLNASHFLDPQQHTAVPAKNFNHASTLLAESEKRYRRLFDLSPVAVYVIDADGVICEFNRHASELWGKVPRIGDTDQLFCGSHKLFLPDGTYMPHERCPMATVVSGEIREARDAEVIIERPDGTRISVIVNIVPLINEHGEIAGAINCFYDITERSRMEGEIRARTLELAQLHHRKDEFLAMLSHELRNPLAPILSAVHLLRLHTGQNQQQRRACDIIERQARQMTHLIDGLMEVSRITSGKIQLQKADIAVSDVVARALETTQPLVTERGHQLTVSLPHNPAWLHADADRMEQVLVNLISNAAKYTDAGGHIWLTVRNNGDRVELRVRDSGVGIAPDLLPHIFELFTQADRSLARSRGGLGIGLCLVHRLVELHGGSIGVDSVQGSGSEFLVSMPAGAAPLAEHVAPAKSPVQDATARRVMVVDDNIDGATSHGALLEACGHEVRIVHDGLAALAMALEFLPDVILLDIGLPGLDGYQVAKRLRQQALFNTTLLVAVTGYGLESDRRQSHEAGFDHHLVKPTSFADVERILASASRRLE